MISRFLSSKKSNRLVVRLMTLVASAIIIVLLIFYSLTIYHLKNRIEKTTQDNILSLGREISQHPIVQDALLDGNSNQDLLDYVDFLEEEFELDYVVVMRTDSIRLSHPKKELIGKRFEGVNDQHIALNKGESYVHTAPGPLGVSIRGFVPVYQAESQEIIGAVSLGKMTTQLKVLMKRQSKPFLYSLLISLSIGLVLARLVAKSLKKQMLNMEPEEIAQVLEERNAVLEFALNMVIITDPEGRITYRNSSSQYELQLEVGDALDDTLPFLAQSFNKQDIEATSKSIRQLNYYNYKQSSYLVSTTHIFVKNIYRGDIFIIYDATDMQMMINQIEDSSAYIQGLTKQSHDFLNKLHVIYGLVDLEKYDELQDYLDDLIEPQGLFTQQLGLLVHNPTIASFFYNLPESLHRTKKTSCDLLSK